MGDFKHIQVTAPDEDDEVIQAGLVEEEAEPVGSMAASDGPEAAEEGGVAAAVVAAKPASRANSDAASAAGGKPAGAREPYRETTLDDLESAPMPLVQKVVIIAALVCIIGALAYYFIAMR